MLMAPRHSENMRLLLCYITQFFFLKFLNLNLMRYLKMDFFEQLEGYPSTTMSCIIEVKATHLGVVVT